MQNWLVAYPDLSIKHSISLKEGVLLLFVDINDTQCVQHLLTKDCESITKLNIKRISHDDKAHIDTLKLVFRQLKQFKQLTRVEVDANGLPDDNIIQIYEACCPRFY